VNPLTDCVWIFTFKRQNIGQKGLHARVGHRALPFCPLPFDRNILRHFWRWRGEVETVRKSVLYKQSTFRIVEINDETVPEAGHASHRKSNSYAPAAS
jgi:hypothetical protein